VRVTVSDGRLSRGASTASGRPAGHRMRLPIARPPSRPGRVDAPYCVGMARIDDLVAQVADTQLRESLERELRELRKRLSFGIVFERHIPEDVALLGHPVGPGDKVVGRAWSTRKQPRVVESIDLDGTAVLRAPGTAAKTETEPVAELMVLKRVGDAIFPGLAPVGTVERAPDRPWHVVINGENFHALQLLAAGLSGRFTCVYIDPPYNSGKKDWRYNNRYVEKSDGYRHSKWLAMMDRRLRLTRHLLADDGVLVVAIDENEHAHLVMLLEQLFRGYSIVSVAIEHNPRGIQGKNFSYTNDFAVFVYRETPEPRISRIPRAEERWEWMPLRNWGTESERATAKNCFYPIYVKGGAVIGFGDVLSEDDHPAAVNTPGPGGSVAVWPIDGNGVERKWRYARNTVEGLTEYLRAEPKRRGDGRIDVDLLKHDDVVRTVWVGAGQDDGGRNRYDANYWGTQLVKRLVPGESFPFPKSLYSTRDALYAAVGDRPDALVLDYFGGSGTTLHATALLNAEDGGRRRCFVVTNNEVAAETQARLRQQKIHPGDEAWEKQGIFSAVTVPRVTAALTGQAGDKAVDGEYIGGRPLAAGLDDNAAFFELEYLDRDEIDLGLALDKLHPLLWMAAEGHGPLNGCAGDPATIDHQAGWAIIHRPAGTRAVFDAITNGTAITDVWVLTDSEDVFSGVAGALPDGVRTMQLYEDLLRRMADTAREPTE
jgi:adenine-specific DNA-methyltransferase